MQMIIGYKKQIEKISNDRQMKINPHYKGKLSANRAIVRRSGLRLSGNCTTVLFKQINFESDVKYF